MSRRIVRAQLHDGFFAKGKNWTNTLPPEKTLQDLEMTLEDTGAISVEWTEGLYRVGLQIGAATVKVAEFAPVKAENNK